MASEQSSHDPDGRIKSEPRTSMSPLKISFSSAACLPDDDDDDDCMIIDIDEAPDQPFDQEIDHSSLPDDANLNSLPTTLIVTASHQSETTETSPNLSVRHEPDSIQTPENSRIQHGPDAPVTSEESATTPVVTAAKYEPDCMQMPQNPKIQQERESTQSSQNSTVQHGPDATQPVNPIITKMAGEHGLQVPDATIKSEAETTSQMTMRFASSASMASEDEDCIVIDFQEAPHGTHPFVLENGGNSNETQMRIVDVRTERGPDQAKEMISKMDADHVMLENDPHVITSTPLEADLLPTLRIAGLETRVDIQRTEAVVASPENLGVSLNTLSVASATQVFSGQVESSAGLLQINAYSSEPNFLLPEDDDKSGILRGSFHGNTVQVPLVQSHGASQAASEIVKTESNEVYTDCGNGNIQDNSLAHGADFDTSRDSGSDNAQVPADVREIVAKLQQTLETTSSLSAATVTPSLQYPHAPVPYENTSAASLRPDSDDDCVIVKHEPSWGVDICNSILDGQTLAVGITTQSLHTVPGHQVPIAATESCHQVPTTEPPVFPNPSSSRQKSLDGFFRCHFKQCDFVTLLPYSFESHLEGIHPLDIRFPCAHCGSEESSSDNLMKHLDHHLARIDSCSYYCMEDCEFHSRNPEDVINHMLMTHPTARHHRCWSCGETFPNAKAFLSHIKENTLLIVSCPYCSAKDTQEKRMVKHLSSAHPDKPRSIPSQKLLLCQERNKFGWQKGHRLSSSSFAPTSTASHVASTSSTSAIQNPPPVLERVFPEFRYAPRETTPDSAVEVSDHVLHEGSARVSSSFEDDDLHLPASHRGNSHRRSREMSQHAQGQRIAAREHISEDEETGRRTTQQMQGHRAINQMQTRMANPQTESANSASSANDSSKQKFRARKQRYGHRAAEQKNSRCKKRRVRTQTAPTSLDSSSDEEELSSQAKRKKPGHRAPQKKQRQGTRRQTRSQRVRETSPPKKGDNDLQRGQRRRACKRKLQGKSGEKIHQEPNEPTREGVGRDASIGPSTRRGTAEATVYNFDDSSSSGEGERMDMQDTSNRPSPPCGATNVAAVSGFDDSSSSSVGESMDMLISPYYPGRGLKPRQVIESQIRHNLNYKKFKCPICDYGTTSEPQIYKHIASFHNSQRLPNITTNTEDLKKEKRFKKLLKKAERMTRDVYNLT